MSNNNALSLLHMYEFIGWRELDEDLNYFQSACITDTVSVLSVLFPSVGFEGYLASHHALSAGFLSKLYMQISEEVSVNNEVGVPYPTSIFEIWCNEC